MDKYCDSIGANAGLIWNILFKRKEGLNLREVGELTKLKVSSINLALGWLARENKIRFFEKDDEMYVELNHPNSELFY